MDTPTIEQILSDLNKLQRYEIEILAEQCGYEPEQDDTDQDLISIINQNKNRLVAMANN